MSLDHPVCCWTPAGERVLLIEKNDDGSGTIYQRGVIVDLDCYGIRMLLLQGPAPKEPRQPRRSGQHEFGMGTVERYARDPAFMRCLQRQVERQLGPLPTTTPPPSAPAKPSLQERAAALVASRQPRPTQQVEERIRERQQLIEERRQGRQQARQQQEAEINQQIDQLLQEVWSSQQARQQRLQPTASDRQLVAA